MSLSDIHPKDASPYQRDIFSIILIASLFIIFIIKSSLDTS